MLSPSQQVASSDHVFCCCCVPLAPLAKNRRCVIQVCDQSAYWMIIVLLSRDEDSSRAGKGSLGVIPIERRRCWW